MSIDIPYSFFRIVSMLALGHGEVAVLLREGDSVMKELPPSYNSPNPLKNRVFPIRIICQPFDVVLTCQIFYNKCMFVLHIQTKTYKQIN